MTKFNPELKEFKTMWGLWWGMTWRFSLVYLGIMFLLGILMALYS